MEIAVSILSSVTVSAALSVALVFLARSWIGERIKNAIRHEYDQKMETFKAQLQTEHQREIVMLKAQLQIAASKHQIQFTSLHIKIAETVAEVYARIVRLRWAVASYVKIMESSSDPSQEIRRKVLADAFGEFHDYYGSHRLYLPKQSIKRIEDFEHILFETANKFKWQVEIPLAEGEPHDVKVWVDAHRTIVDTIPPLLENLEDEFRSLLGQPVTSPQGAE